MVRLMDPRLIMWESVVGAWRVEAARVELDDGGLRATGTQLGVDPQPYRLDYRLDATDGFRTRSLDLALSLDGGERRTLVVAPQGGEWVDGAVDCDLGFSPLTNAMPVARTGLRD